MPAILTGMIAARAWLVHPVTVLAVAVLLVNDHLLKPAYPGVVTGKLSDVAGLVLAPPLLAVALAVALRRQPDRAIAAVSLAVTGFGFVAVKAFAPGAAVASAVWSVVAGRSVILADLTDLVALPALGLSWWAYSRARRRPDQVLRRVGVLVVLPVAAFAVAATSAPDYPDAIAVTVADDMIMVGQGNAYHQGYRDVRIWRGSADGGRTWRYLSPAESADLARLSLVDVTARQGCVPDEPRRCYRAVPEHLRVEETSDGGTTWTVSWEVTDNQREVLARAHDALGDAEVYLASNSLAVQAVPGGHVVVVANGRDGYARRDTDGRWERIGFGTRLADSGETFPDPPVPLEPDPFLTFWREVCLVALAGLIAVGVGAWRAARRRSVAVILFLATLAVGTGVQALGAILSLADDDLVADLAAEAFTALGLVTAFIGAFGAITMAAGSRDLRARRAWLIAGVGALTAAAGCAVFTGWVADLYAYRVAAPVALVLSLAGIATAGWLGQRYGVRTSNTS